MKKLMVALLGLSLAVGYVVPTFAQEEKKTEKKKQKSSKPKKEKKTETKPGM